MTRLLASSALAAAMLGAAHAGDLSAGRSKDTPQMVPPAAGFTAKPSQGPGAKRSADMTSRALPGDDEDAYGVVTRSRNGQEKRSAPGKPVLDALKAEKKADAGTAPDGADPALEGETARAVVGQDDRVAVKSTRIYPFNVVGLIETVHTKTNTTFDCTAALIGPSTVITAAQCVYHHGLEGGWMDKMTFWPGINGESDIPVGGFDWANVSVLEGYVTKYDGGYDSVWPYDVALVELAQPIGDQVGWLGYGSYPNLGDFQATLVGYHDDKEPVWTQWRSSCNVIAENVGQADIIHDCDAVGWATGAPVYLYDKADKSRRIVALNMGDLGSANWALRITDPIAAWIGENNK
jgi:V8-like Glu-specific endopeptidase